MPGQSGKSAEVSSSGQARKNPKEKKKGSETPKNEPSNLYEPLPSSNKEITLKLE